MQFFKKNEFLLLFVVSDSLHNSNKIDLPSCPKRSNSNANSCLTASRIGVEGWHQYFARMSNKGGAADSGNLSFELFVV